MIFSTRIFPGLVLLLPIFYSCGEKAGIREYVEIESVVQAAKKDAPFVHPPIDGMPQQQTAAAAGSSEYQWETPSGWGEQTGSGMRTVTFFPVEGDSTLQCVVVELQGDAGGLESNVIRWMQQLKLIVPQDKALADFLGRQAKFQTAGGFPGVFIDLTTILSGNITDETSGLVGVITAGGKTLYVRMFGPKPVLLKEKARLLSLCKSFRKAG